MKKIIASGLILMCVNLPLQAQIYTPSGTIQGTSSNNNVGIGATSPTEKLEVYNSDTTPGTISLKSFRNDFGYVDVGRISAKQASVEVSRIGMPRAGGTNTGYLTFWTKADNAADLTEKVRIAENGNMGIGTATPTQKLDINGNINMAGSAGRRLFMGGAGGSTFGIAYDSNYPNFGIFYTEGEPDYVSISPNGNATAGVMNVLGNGNVGIGTSNPTSKLTVAGNINSREVKVSVDAGADFVFDKDYELPSLNFLDSYIKENKHLPEIVSAKEMQENGINLSEMNIKLLQKIEELTLYVIEQNKKILQLEKKLTNIFNRDKKK